MPARARWPHPGRWRICQKRPLAIHGELPSVIASWPDKSDAADDIIPDRPRPRNVYHCAIGPAPAVLLTPTVLDFLDASSVIEHPNLNDNIDRLMYQREDIRSVHPPARIRLLDQKHQLLESELAA